MDSIPTAVLQYMYSIALDPTPFLLVSLLQTETISSKYVTVFQFMICN